MLPLIRFYSPDLSEAPEVGSNALHVLPLWEWRRTLSAPLTPLPVICSVVMHFTEISSDSLKDGD